MSRKDSKNARVAPETWQEGGTEYQRLRLDAVARAEPPEKLLSQMEMAQWLGGVTGQTIRDWVAKGMPREGSERRPLYNGPDCLCWAQYHTYLTHHRPSRRGFIRMEDARHFDLQRQMDDDPERLFVVVPLEHDHPRRAAQLRIAAEGVPSRSSEDDAA